MAEFSTTTKVLTSFYNLPIIFRSKILSSTRKSYVNENANKETTSKYFSFQIRLTSFETRNWNSYALCNAKCIMPAASMSFFH